MRYVFDHGRPQLFVCLVEVMHAWPHETDMDAIYGYWVSIDLRMHVL